MPYACIPSNAPHPSVSYRVHHFRAMAEKTNPSKVRTVPRSPNASESAVERCDPTASCARSVVHHCEVDGRMYRTSGTLSYRDSVSQKALGTKQQDAHSVSTAFGRHYCTVYSVIT